MIRPLVAAAALAFVALASSSAFAQNDQPPPPAPAPYSLPFQLRGASPVSAVRSDTAIASYKVADQGGTTIASMLLASYKITPELAPFVRFAWVHNAPPVGDNGSSLVNPAVGATYGIKLGEDFRLGLFLGLTIPVGQGGGNSGDKNAYVAAGSGVYARSAMDNAMFAVNYFTVFPGVDLAWVKGGLTVQVEATFFRLTRTRGDAVEKDDGRTNFTTGLHVGYFVIPMLSLGAEIRHQRWLSTPAAVDADGTKRDQTTFAVGPRLHLEIAPKVWFRPGVAYAQGIDDPMSAAKYRIVQIDLPVIF